MYSTKTDFIVSLLAEYEDQFIHYFWETCALWRGSEIRSGNVPTCTLQSLVKATRSAPH